MASAKGDKKALELHQTLIQARRRQIEEWYARNGTQPPKLCTVTCSKCEGITKYEVYVEQGLTCVECKFNAIVMNKNWRCKGSKPAIPTFEWECKSCERIVKGWKNQSKFCTKFCSGYSLEDCKREKPPLVRLGSAGRKHQAKGNRDHFEFTRAELAVKRGTTGTTRKGTMESFFRKK